MNLTNINPGDIIAIHSPDTTLQQRRIIAHKLQIITGNPVICTGQPISILRKEPTGEPSFKAASQPEESIRQFFANYTLGWDVAPGNHPQPEQSHPCPSVSIRGSSSPEPIRITRPGYHAESGLWFFADCVFSGSGCAFEAKARLDRGDIIEVEGPRYLIDYGTETAPLMEPRKAARSRALDMLLTSLHTPHGTAAYLAIGGIIAYAFTPETLRLYNVAPGIWIHGRKASGKTTLAQTLMALWGMDENTSFQSTYVTPSVFNRLLACHSCIPVHFDEYRVSGNDLVNSIPRTFFNRKATTKGGFGTFTTATITPGTSPLITGEGQPGDAATASRFIMVECGNKFIQSSVGKHVINLAAHSRLIPHLFAAGRDKAAETFKRILNTWAVETAHLGNDRQRLVMGIAYAAFAAVIGEDNERTSELKAHVFATLSNSLPSVSPTHPEPEPNEDDNNNHAFRKALEAITQSDTAGNRYTAEEALQLIQEIMPRATKPSASH